MGWPDQPPHRGAAQRLVQGRRDLAAQKEICRQMQLQAFMDVPYIPLGQALGPTAYRKELQGVLTGLPVFWNITRS